MKKIKPIIVDFTDRNLEYKCVVIKNQQKITMTKEKFMLQLIKYKQKDVISIQQRDQLLGKFNFLLRDVYKFIVVFPDNSKIIIKNVEETDIYFPELEAMTGYKTKICFNRDENYPDFPKENDGKYINKLYTKKYKNMD